MKKHLFLTAPAGSGKSACIRGALGAQLLCAGGFVTEHQWDGEGRLLRSSLLPTAATGGAEGFSPLPYLDLSAPTPRHDNEVFRGEGVKLLREAAYYPFAVLDAIGGFELLIPQFREALADLLSSDVPLLGVLYTQQESVELCRRLGLGERAELSVGQLWKALRADPDPQIERCAGLTRRLAQRSVEDWVREYAR